VRCVLEDGSHCDACAKVGLACTFANPESLRKRPSTKQAAEQLSARIMSLERLLQAVDPTLDLNNLPNPKHIILNPSLRFQSCAASAFQLEPSSAETSAQEASYHQSRLSAVLAAIHGLQTSSNPAVTQLHRRTQSDKSKPMGEGLGVDSSPDHYIGPHSGLNFLGARTDFEIPNLPPWNLGTEYPVDEYLRLRHEEYVSSTKCFYPEPDLERDLIKIYFQHFHPLVPIIHPTTFYNLHNSGLANNDLTFRALCLLMLSIASRWSSDPRVQLDLAGQPQPSRQFVGFRFLYAGYLGIFRLNDHRTTLCHLQAFTLLTIAAFGSLQSTTTWIFAEQGLIRAQACGAHREVHHFWNADPLQDYLRRQVFYQLYEHAQRARNALFRMASLQEEDFDVEPAHVDCGDPLGIFVNPYSIISPEVHEAYVAFDQIRVSLWRLGSLRSILPLLYKLQKDSKRNTGGEASLKYLKSLVDQLDLNAGKWLDNIPPSFKRPELKQSPEMLFFSVMVITCYQKFQMLMHHNLFHYQEGDPERKTTKTNPHINKCAELAISSIEEINKLRLQNLMTAGFYWLSGDLFLPTSLLACSIRKQRGWISPQEDQARRKSILLAIAILDDLAPSIHVAAVYSKICKKIFSLLDVENASVAEALESPLREPRVVRNPFPNAPPQTGSGGVTSMVRSGSMSHIEPCKK